MTTTPVQLNDNQLESICGGNQGTYMSQLSEFVHTSERGSFFNFQLAGKDYTLNTATSDDKFAKIIKRAEECGGVTFISESGKKKTFTAAQLKAMF